MTLIQRRKLTNKDGLSIKFFPEDRERIRRAALKNGLAIVPWLRSIILREVKKEENDDSNG